MLASLTGGMSHCKIHLINIEGLSLGMKLWLQVCTIKYNI